MQPSLLSSPSTQCPFPCRNSPSSQKHDGIRIKGCRNCPHTALDILKDLKKDDSYPRYSRRIEILIGYAKVKAHEALRMKAQGVPSNK